MPGGRALSLVVMQLLCGVFVNVKKNSLGNILMLTKLQFCLYEVHKMCQYLNEQILRDPIVCR